MIQSNKCSKRIKEVLWVQNGKKVLVSLEGCGNNSRGGDTSH